MKPTLVFLKVADVGDGAGEVILQHRFITGIEKRNGGLLVEAGDGEPEVEILFIGALAADAVQIGGVLGIGIRLGVEVFDAHLASGQVCVAFEQIINLAHVGFDSARHGLTFTGSVITDDDGAIQLLENRLGAAGESVAFVFGEVDVAVANGG